MEKVYEPAPQDMDPHTRAALERFKGDDMPDKPLAYDLEKDSVIMPRGGYSLTEQGKAAVEELKKDDGMDKPPRKRPSRAKKPEMAVA